MRRKTWLSIAMLAIGASLLVAASLAGPAASGTAKSAAPNGPKAGGTLRMSQNSPFDYLDPAIEYFAQGWEIEYLTCAKLFNYPDKAAPQGSQPQPEVVKSFTVSKDGKTYTFKLFNTFKYNTGRTVAAADFVTAFNRDADPVMQSPMTIYMHDIVGADAAIDGKVKTISGVKALSPYVLQVKLLSPAPDFVSRMTMPFMCPLPPGTPHDSAGITNPPGSGPYYLSSVDLNRQVIIKRNPNYKGKRPHVVDQMVITVGTSLEACELQTEKNQLDYCIDGIPPTAYKQLADKYGVNKQRLFIKTILGTRYYALNQLHAFKNNLQLRKAINYAVDRPALVRAAGYLAGHRTDQILPPAMTKDVAIYPIQGANPKVAKKLAAGHMPSGNHLTLYDANAGAYVTRAQIFQYDMKQIGIDVTITQFSRTIEHGKCGTKSENFDVCEENWIVDYADPVTYFDPLLNGKNIHETQNGNESYINDPKWNKAIDTANQLTGAARSAAYQALDINMTRQAAPWASFQNTNNRDFVSSSTGCYLFQPVFLMDWAVTCKK
jgi:ABC-type oligopeptide transport system substrate-binding subunit